MQRADTRLMGLAGLLLAATLAAGQDATRPDFDQLERLQPVTEVEPGDFTIRTPESILRIYVSRAGLLAGLGHNHVVHTRSLSGSVRLAPEPPNSSAEFALDHEQLGLEPYRVVGGTLRVAEALRFELELLTQRD